MANKYVGISTYTLLVEEDQSINQCFYTLYYILKNIFGISDIEQRLYGGYKTSISWFNDHIAIIIEDTRRENTGYGYMDYFIVGDKEGFDPTDSSTYLKRIQMVDYIGMGIYVGLTPGFLDVHTVYPLSVEGSDKTYNGYELAYAISRSRYIIIGKMLICIIRDEIDENGVTLFYIRGTLNNNNGNYYALIKNSDNSYTLDEPDYNKLLIYHDYHDYNYFNSSNGIRNYETNSLVSTPVMFTRSPIMFISDNMSKIKDPVPNDYIWQGYIHESLKEDYVKHIKSKWVSTAELTDQFGQIVTDNKEYYIYSALDYYINVDPSESINQYVYLPQAFWTYDLLITPREFIMMNLDGTDSNVRKIGDAIGSLVGYDTKCCWFWENIPNTGMLTASGLKFYIKVYENEDLIASNKSLSPKFDISTSPNQKNIEATDYAWVVRPTIGTSVSVNYYFLYNGTYITSKYAWQIMFIDGTSYSLFNTSAFGTATRAYSFTLTRSGVLSTVEEISPTTNYSIWCINIPFYNWYYSPPAFDNVLMLQSATPLYLSGVSSVTMTTTTKAGFGFEIVPDFYNTLPKSEIIDPSDITVES